MAKLIIIPLLLVGLAGCTRDEAPNQKVSKPAQPAEKAEPAVNDKTVPTEEKAVEPALAPETGASDLVMKKVPETELPDGMPLKGKFVAAVSWRDKNHFNLLVFSKLVKKKDYFTSEYLFAYLYSERDDGERDLVRTVRDKVEDCEFDLLAEFEPKTISVTDLDRDGIGEVTFGYRLVCTSDISPVDMKLLVLEGGDKYIIRGTSTLDMGEESIAGTKRVDKSFKEGPPEFLAHATKVWAVLDKSY